MKLKVKYDEYGTYIEYKNKTYYLSCLQKDYNDFVIKEMIYEPINTYVVIEEKDSDKE